MLVTDTSQFSAHPQSPNRYAPKPHSRFLIRLVGTKLNLLVKLHEIIVSALCMAKIWVVCAFDLFLSFIMCDKKSVNIATASLMTRSIFTKLYWQHKPFDLFDTSLFRSFFACDHFLLFNT